MHSSSATPKPLTARVVLICFVAFFGVVVGVNMLMMKFAIDTLSGTEVESAYRASLAYESEIRAARDQSERNWKIEAHIERAADGIAMLRINARDGKGAPLVGLNFSGRLERPADKRGDRFVTFAEIQSGLYSGRLAGVSPGQWDLVVEGDQSGRRMFLSKNRIVLN